ncbi:L,D-transpeptidase, partial [Candidatus Gottesmanbacteria bacterium]|nr:L,D-transpeptidase [Candidatus Gottesmanbacteria bacterium]
GPGYYLPDVPYVMYFYLGYAIHGTYWHNNFGHPMSHGCVNMRIEDAKTLFEWSSPQVTDTKAWSTNATSENAGTKVVIYGTTPEE